MSAVVAAAVAGAKEVLPPDLWLERVRRDPSVTNAAFRIAHAVAAHSKRGSYRARLTEIAATAGTTAPTASHCLDRLGALGYLMVRRQGPGAPVELKLSRGPPQPFERDTSS